jgi:hypothetical protein
MDLSVVGEEVVKDFFCDCIVKISDIEGDWGQSLGLRDEVELGVHGKSSREGIHIHFCF